jgi:hypothetical protein
MLTPISIELFAYPWDIVDRGPERFGDDCCELGVNRVHVATLYHSGKFLLPRNTRSKVQVVQPGRLFVPVAPGAFAGSIAPETAQLAATGWLQQLHTAALARGIDLAAWTVFHHTSALAGRHRESAVQNVFGDVYPFALCPSRPEVRAFSVELASVMQAAGTFRVLDLETIGFLGYSHGYHHEVTAIPCGPLETFLLSLCFCDACRAAGEQAGIDMEELRIHLRRTLLTRFENDDTAAGAIEQFLTFLALSEPLQRLIRVRFRTVTSLVQQIREIWRAGELAVFTSSFVGSPSNIWMEGVCLGELHNVADIVQLLAYSREVSAVNSDLAFCRAQAHDMRRVSLTLNLGASATPTLAHASEIADFAWRQGVRRFAFFNYGLLGPKRLGWVGEIARTLRSRKDNA